MDPPGKLSGNVIHPVSEADATQRFLRLFFIRDAVKVLRQHDVLESRQIRNEMKLLEDEADLFGAVPR